MGLEWSASPLRRRQLPRERPQPPRHSWPHPFSSPCRSRSRSSRGSIRASTSARPARLGGGYAHPLPPGQPRPGVDPRIHGRFWGLMCTSIPWVAGIVGGAWHGEGMESKKSGGSLDELLRRQPGVIGRGQVLSCGMTDKILDRRVRSGGRWQRLLPGVYLTVTGTPTRDQLDTAALLYAGPGSVLSGAAALRRHGGGVPPPATIDVLIPAKRRRKSVAFVVIRVTTRLPEQVCYVGPVQYVLPARAVADMVRWLDDLASVRATVAAAVQTKMCTVDQLMAELRSGPGQGSAFFRAALAEVMVGIRSSTAAEMKHLLNRGRLPLPLFNATLS